MSRTSRDEHIAESDPLLEKVMDSGKTMRPHPALEDVRERFETNFSCLDDKFKVIHDVAVYPVTLSRRLEKLQ